jgi:hypothetical protein
MQNLELPSFSTGVSPSLGTKDSSLLGALDGVSTAGVFWLAGEAEGVSEEGAEAGAEIGTSPSSFKSTNPNTCDICVTLPESAEFVQNVVTYSKCQYGTRVKETFPART